MRRSSRVTLVLVGLAGLAGCGGDDARRDVYRTREDCLADWGNRPQDCTPSTDQKHHGLGYFMGPAYPVRSAGSGMGWSDSSSDGGGGSGSRRSLGSSVSRGGFGSSSRSSGG
jgi:uncharacterized protein YgiB involved in biofilm formation